MVIFVVVVHVCCIMVVAIVTVVALIRQQRSVCNERVQLAKYGPSLVALKGALLSLLTVPWMCVKQSSQDETGLI